MPLAPAAARALHGVLGLQGMTTCSLVSSQVEQDYEKGSEDVDMRSQAYIKKAADRMPNIGRKARSSLADS